MTRTHYPTKREAERRFPHHVDVRVPEGGLGARLNLMLDWCRANISAGTWEQHGHSTRKPGQIPQDHAKFYFASADDAELFRWKWLAHRLSNTMPVTQTPF